MGVQWFPAVLFARSRQCQLMMMVMMWHIINYEQWRLGLLVFCFIFVLGEQRWGTAEYEPRMCLCRDKESESVRNRNSSSVRERSERGEERRVATLCFAGT